MRNLKLIILLAIAISQLGFIQSNGKTKLNSELFGEWEFVSLTNEDGTSVKWDKNTRLSFYADSTFSHQYSAEGLDAGRWYFEKKFKRIFQREYLTKPYNHAELMMIEDDWVKKDRNGEYYSECVLVILELTAEKLVILEPSKTKMTFQKVK